MISDARASQVDAAPEGGQPCDLAMDPKDAPACVDDADGVFVDATNGNDSGDGTKAHPFASITKAIAVGSKNRVYICSGTYTDALTLSSQHAVSLYGGFACGTWAYTGTKASIAPASGLAVSIGEGVTSTIEDLQITGNAGSAPGASAIAIFLDQASLTIQRATVSAGAGAMGQAGSLGKNAPNYTKAATAGATAQGNTPGMHVDCGCTDGTTSHGGDGASSTAAAKTGSASPAVGADNFGGSGATSCTAGSVGAGGATSAGGNASSTSGALTSSGWAESSNATSGGNGNPGQGGGGGGAEINFTAAGGGGACGGCGGTGGGPGGSGGASYGVLSYQSTLVINDSTVTSGAGGLGGTGGIGQDGQDGGAGGQGPDCFSGNGGPGGGGSGGGGGAGGSSAAVAYSGAAPQTNASTLTVGTPGGAGTGGMGGTGSGTAGNMGATGQAGAAMATLLLP